MISPNTPPWLTFLIYALSVFRLSVLLSDDTGPFKIFQKLRSKLKKEAKTNPVVKKSDVAEGIQCRRCSGVWFAILVTIFVYGREYLIDWVATLGNAVLVCFALSGAALIMHRAFPAK